MPTRGRRPVIRTTLEQQYHLLPALNPSSISRSTRAVRNIEDIAENGGAEAPSVHVQ